MIDARGDWLQTATEIRSFRQMYRFAGEVAGSALANIVEKRAARKVIQALRDVIEAPIAEAAILAKARKCFARLVKVLRQQISLPSSQQLRVQS